jgi:hypothetical protein
VWKATRARSLASPGGAKGAGARHAHEWSGEILTDRYKISTDREIFVGG